MPVRIGDSCIFCGACSEECPSGAISEGQEIYEVDAAKCFECVGITSELLCTQVCPVRVIEVPSSGEAMQEEQALLARAQALMPHRTWPALPDLTEANSRFRRKMPPEQLDQEEAHESDAG